VCDQERGTAAKIPANNASVDSRKREFCQTSVYRIRQIIQGIKDGPVHIKKNSFPIHHSS
jgi:hypothetical protein